LRELSNLRFDGLGQQRTRAVAQDLCEGIGKGPWLGELNDVTVRHGVSLLHWRSGGVEHHHDTPPYPVTPSPTSGHSSLMHQLILLAVCLLAIPGIGSAQTSLDDPNTPAGWAWAKILNDEIADFNEKCERTLDPRQETGWDDPCRRVPPEFLRNVLTDRKYRDQIPQHGARLVGASIDGTVDLTDSEIKSEVWVKASRVEGKLVLTDSHWSLPFVLSGSTIIGDFSAERMRADSIFQLSYSTFAKILDARDAKFRSNLELEHSSVIGLTTLRSTEISGNLDLEGSSFKNGLDANKTVVGGNLFMREGAAFEGEVDLRRAKVGSNLELENSSFAKAVNGNGLAVTGNLYMNKHAAFHGELNLRRVVIGGVIDLRDATATRIDISGSTAAELDLQDLGWWCAAQTSSISSAVAGSPGGPAKITRVQWPLKKSVWRNADCGGRLPTLALRNVHAEAFQDSVSAWPPRVHLEGFHYERLGGVADTLNDMRQRSSEEWGDWLARDRPFGTQSYTELSSVLAAAGRRDTADAILLAGRERERHDACATWSRPGTCAWLTFLSYAAGYGIGLYTFSVLLWVIGLTILGADILWYSQNARKHGYWWRFGASFHRLLPIIELSKEFTNFFDNPTQTPPDEPRNLSGPQTAYFAVHAIAGWVLGFFLLAAMGGVIQKS
jgi:hypothetical protein